MNVQSAFDTSDTDSHVRLGPISAVFAMDAVARQVAAKLLQSPGNADPEKFPIYKYESLVEVLSWKLIMRVQESLTYRHAALQSQLAFELRHRALDHLKAGELEELEAHIRKWADA